MRKGWRSGGRRGVEEKGALGVRVEEEGVVFRRKGWRRKERKGTGWRRKERGKGGRRGRGRVCNVQIADEIILISLISLMVILAHAPVLSNLIYTKHAQ